MMSNRTGRPSGALKITFCGIMAALGVVIMLVGGLLGVATYCAPLLAAMCLIPVLIEFGQGFAWLTWFVTAALSALLSADKEGAFFYVFLGYYPIIRLLFSRIANRPLRFAAKLLFFIAAVAVMYLFLLFVLRLDAVTEELGSVSALVNALYFAALIAILAAYDAVLGVVENLYMRRIRPKLRFLG